MVFKDFRTRVLIRVILLGGTLSLLVYLFGKTQLIFAALLVTILIVIQLADLFHFVTQTNRKLTRFLESIRYSDFISGFTLDHKLGRSFKDLNLAFNEVLEAFRKARSEKEEHWQYLNTVVQQVRTGILSFDPDGHIELINANAKKYLNHSAIRNIHELKELNPSLWEIMVKIKPGKSELYKKGNQFGLAIQTTEIRIRGKEVKLITLQNIQSELQQQELEAWQNLTRVLRHEIMNSITPISSLTSTLLDIIAYDLTKTNEHFQIKSEGAEDLKEGLETIQNRSKSLIQFIDAYREYTSLPKPKFQTVMVKELLEKVSIFIKPEIKKTNIHFTFHCTSDYLSFQGDPDMVEQVLINLLKNSIEALQETLNPTLQLKGHYDENSVIIEVIDNGQGIIEEALESIFVPFFTTKKTGSGIGLSLSRQIMQMHGGSLSVTSEPDVQTIFRLRF